MSRFSRRVFFQGVLGLGASAAVGAERAFGEEIDERMTRPPARPALADDPEQLRSLQEVDVAIIGSGYGGAITAARLAGQVGSVVVLERGREWRPGDFPRKPLQWLGEIHINTHKAINRLGLFRLTYGTGLNVLSGSGLGGTSLINAAVALRPEPTIFDDRRWPKDITYAELDRYYAEAESMLSVGKTPGGLSRFAKTRVMADAAGAVGLPIEVMPLAINNDVGGASTGADPMPNAQGVLQTRCTACGDCMTGCNFGSKNTLDTNYLALAKQRGARMFTQTEVKGFSRTEDGRYQIAYERRGTGGVEFRGTLLAKTLILSAGTLGSTELMMRAQQGGLRLSPALGQGMSGNGDTVTMTYNGDERTEMYGIGTRRPRVKQQGECGPTAVSAIRVRGIDGDHECVMQDLSIPSLFGEISKKPLALFFGRTFSGKSWAARRALIDLLPGRRSKGALAQSLVVIGVGYDRAAGKMVLDRDGDGSIYWPTVYKEGPFGQLNSWIQRLTAGTRGIFKTVTQWITMDGALLHAHRNDVVTAHPLGGCRMADSVEDGVVDSLGRVYDPTVNRGVYAGLYVCDGSIIPTPLGLNPLLTISALAERIAVGILARDRAQSGPKVE